jgi:hypothetical protein
MRQVPLSLLITFFMGASMAGTMTPATRAEIDALLNRLETSQCDFQRNGTWHSAADARSHLLVKLNYLEERGMVVSTEQFIERAATESSMTGRPYLVRCAKAAPAPSRPWLLFQLQLMRGAPGAKQAP